MIWNNNYIKCNILCYTAYSGTLELYSRPNDQIDGDHWEDVNTFLFEDIKSWNE